jgi:hypothetical protein
MCVRRREGGDPLRVGCRGPAGMQLERTLEHDAEHFPNCTNLHILTPLPRQVVFFEPFREGWSKKWVNSTDGE